MKLVGEAGGSGAGGGFGQLEGQAQVLGARHGFQHPPGPVLGELSVKSGGFPGPVSDGSPGPPGAHRPPSLPSHKEHRGFSGQKALRDPEK